MPHKPTFSQLLKQNVTLDRLRRDEKKIFVTPNALDFISYPAFLKYFSDLQTISEHNVVIGINFTYGWMPTIFDFRSDKLSEVSQILNSAKQGVTPTEPEFEILKGCFNNSLVGTSKLLHFVNPDKFVIWDSRVYQYATGQSPYDYRLSNTKSYLSFLEYCKDITNLPGYNEIHRSMVKKFGHDKLTKLRSVELVMYLSSR